MSKYLCVRCVFSLLRRPSIHSSPQIFVLDNQSLKIFLFFWKSSDHVILHHTHLWLEHYCRALWRENNNNAKVTKYQCTQLLRSFSLSVFLLSSSSTFPLLPPRWWCRGGGAGGRSLPAGCQAQAGALCCHGEPGPSAQIFQWQPGGWVLVQEVSRVGCFTPSLWQSACQLRCNL